MTQDFTNEELARAAELVCKTMLDALPPTDECTHEFSDLFSSRIEHLMGKERPRRKAIKYWQRTAAACIAAMLSISVWLAVDVSARAALLLWVREIYEQTVVYQFFGGDSRTSGPVPFYTTTWLPDGYEQTADTGEGQIRMVTFTKDDDFIYLQYWYASAGITSDITTGTTVPESVRINGSLGEFYTAAIHGETNELIWVDESTNIVFSISAHFDKKTVIRIAESVSLG